MNEQYPVPALMFHSIGAEKKIWPYSYLSESVNLFRKKMEYLLAKGYHFIFHDDLYHYMRDNRPLPDRALMLTFDDGYLDNWVVVYPILRECGVKFTIYVSQEFVDPSPAPRPTLEDVNAGKIREHELQVLGYLSWEEMRIMEASGLVDIQSHTSTHTWHFTDGNILDYYNPHNKPVYPWVYWNNNPEEKPFWLKESGIDNLWGIPIYTNKRAMIARRYMENDELKQHLALHVREHGGKDFFHRQNWEEELHGIARRYRTRCEKVHNENAEEHKERMHHELVDNKAAIERHLRKEVRYVCWPGGAYNDELIRLAEESGYWATTVKEGNNVFGDNPRGVHRISSGNPAGAQRFPWKYTLFTLQFYLSRFQRKYWALALDGLYRRTSHSAC